jgi:hypothetical protein
VEIYDNGAYRWLWRIAVKLVVNVDDDGGFGGGESWLEVVRVVV